MGGDFPGWSFPDTAKIKAFMRKNFSLAKKILKILMMVLLATVWFKSGQTEEMQFSKLPTKSAVLKYFHHQKVVMAVEKTLNKTISSGMYRKTVLHWKHLPIIQIVVQLMTKEARFFRNTEKKIILGLKVNKYCSSRRISSSRTENF